MNGEITMMEVDKRISWKIKSGWEDNPYWFCDLYVASDPVEIPHMHTTARVGAAPSVFSGEAAVFFQCSGQLWPIAAREGVLYVGDDKATEESLVALDAPEQLLEIGRQYDKAKEVKAAHVKRVCEGMFNIEGVEVIGGFRNKWWPNDFIAIIEVRGRNFLARNIAGCNCRFAPTEMSGFYSDDIDYEAVKGDESFDADFRCFANPHSYRNPQSLGIPEKFMPRPTP